MIKSFKHKGLRILWQTNKSNKLPADLLKRIKQMLELAAINFDVTSNSSRTNMTLSIAFKRTLYYVLVTLSFLESVYFIYINLYELIKRSQGQYTIFSQMSWLTDGQAEIYCGFLTLVFILLLALLGHRLNQRNKKSATFISGLTLVFV